MKKLVLLIILASAIPVTSTQEQVDSYSFTGRETDHWGDCGNRDGLCLPPVILLMMSGGD